MNINSYEKLKNSVLLESTKSSVNYSSFIFHNFKDIHIEEFVCEKLFSNDSINKKIILTKTPINNTYVDNIEKSNIYESYKIKYSSLSENGEYYSILELKSTFDVSKRIDAENVYYMYDVNNEGLAYNQRKITHKLKNRIWGLNFGLRYENISIHKNEEKYNVNSPSVFFNLIASTKIEFEGSFPYAKSKIIIPLENYDLKYPSIFNLNLRFFILDINKYKLLEGFKPYLTYGIKLFEHTNNLDKKLDGVVSTCFVPGVGIEKKILNLDSFELCFRLNYQYGYFKESILKDYKLNSISFDTIFRF